MKIILKCLIALLPLWLIWNTAANNFEGYADGEASYYKWNHDVVNSSDSKDYDVVILGDSTSNAAYLPEFLSGSTVNLALGGASATENYYILYNYLKNHSAPKVCYLSYADAHLQSEDCYWQRAVYFHLLDCKQAKEIYDRAVYYQDMSVVQTREQNGEDGYQKLIEHYLWWPAHYMPSLMNSGLNGRKVEFENAYNNDALHRGVYIANGAYENTMINEGDPDSFFINPLYDEYYRKTIALCEENGIKVRIIKLPTSPSIQYRDSYVESFNNYYNGLKEEYPDITVNWIKDGYTQYDFSDIHHMNLHGSKKFSQCVRNLFPEDFAQQDIPDTYNAAIIDYAYKSPRFDDLVDYAYCIKSNVIVYVKNGTVYNQDLDGYAQYFTSYPLENGDAIGIYNFSDQTVTAEISGNNALIRDEAVGELSVNQTGAGIYSITFPNSEPMNLVEGMQIDLGAEMYSDTVRITKEYDFRDKELSQVVSR